MKWSKREETEVEKAVNLKAIEGDHNLKKDIKRRQSSREGYLR